MSRKISIPAVIVAALPYVLLGWPWFAAFRDPWFEGGGLTAEQLQTGPGYLVAFSVAIVCSLVTSYVLSLLVVRGRQTTLWGGLKVGLLAWVGFVGPLLATQYTFEARSLAYFAVTAGHPLLGLLFMGAIIGWWNSSEPEGT